MYKPNCNLYSYFFTAVRKTLFGDNKWQIYNIGKGNTLLQTQELRFFFEVKVFSKIERQTSPLWVNLI
jgi:hypothetical protein